MMAGNPNNWWNMQHNNIRLSSTNDDQQHETEVNPTINLLISQTHPNNSLLTPLQFLHGGSSSSSSLLPFLSSAEPHTQDHFPHSWSQLLMGGMGSEEEERYNDPIRRVLNEGVQLDIKQEVTTQNNNNNNLELYNGNQFHNNEEQDHQVGVSNTNSRVASTNWTQIIPVSSPKSCITTLNTTTNNNNNNNNNNNTNNNNSNMLDFSTNKRSLQADQNHQHADHTVNSECNSSSTTNGGVPPKKPRVQSSSTPPLKVRKEKLGDRITALHQLVSPFGKTDTASVLLEAIGYIRFLQGQIEALSSPYMGNNHASAKNQHVVHGERNCLFPDHPGQLLNDSCLKRRGAPNQEDNKDGSKDLKGRGLCLVPISCTQLVGSENGADYWAQSLGGGF